MKIVRVCVSCWLILLLAGFACNHARIGCAGDASALPYADVCDSTAAELLHTKIKRLGFIESGRRQVVDTVWEEYRKESRDSTLVSLRIEYMHIADCYAHGISMHYDVSSPSRYRVESQCRRISRQIDLLYENM